MKIKVTMKFRKVQIVTVRKTLEGADAEEFLRQQRKGDTRDWLEGKFRDTPRDDHETESYKMDYYLYSKENPPK